MPGQEAPALRGAGGGVTGGGRPGPRGRRAPAAWCARGGPRCRRGVRRRVSPSHNPLYALPTPHRLPPAPDLDQ